MTSLRAHRERHRADRVGWLRAAVLGANDGIVSTASLVLGVAAAGSSHGAVLVSGIAGLVAGAMSMAAGEYVSVHSQADTENADLAREHRELEEQPASELNELAGIYVSRGLAPDLARQVAVQLMAHDALGTHARDELGLSDAACTGLGYVVGGASLAFLALLGAVSARAGGAPVPTATWRVTFWGALAMGVTAGIGALFGAVV